MINGGLETINIQNGLRINDGLELYPLSEKFPYNGTVYGPLLPQLLSVVFKLNFDLILSAKLIIILFILLTLYMIFKNQKFFSFELLLLLTIFYSYFISIRPDMLILFCVTYVLLGSRNKIFALLLPFTISALVLLKAYSVFFAIYALVIKQNRIKGIILQLSICLFIISLFFKVTNHSIIGWIETNLAALRHGYNYENMFAGLLIFLILIILSFASNFQLRKFLQDFDKIGLLVVVAAHFLTFAVASKNGAGPSHFIPLILIDAFVIKKYSLARNENSLTLFLVIPVVFFLVFSLRSNANVISSDFGNMHKKLTEIRYLDNKFPGLFMGQSGSNSNDVYFANFLRQGNNIQLDYSTFADLNLNGLDDSSFANKLENCYFDRVIVPNGGSPFSLISPYTGNSLFPVARIIFTERYSLITKGLYFDVHECKL